MPDYSWPPPENRNLIGKRISRVDSPVKVSGRAKYTYDYNPSGMLYGKILRSPHAKAKIVTIDTSSAEKMPGVKAVQIAQKVGSTVQWAGDEVVGVAAVDEVTAEDAIRAIKVTYQPLPHLVSDAEPPAGAAETPGPLSVDDLEDMLDNQVRPREMAEQIQQYGITFKADDKTLEGLKSDGATDDVLAALRTAPVHENAESKPKSNYSKAAAQTQGEPDKAFSDAEIISEGIYGAPVITHCCLESHGATPEWTDDDHLMVHISTQNVSGIAGQMADPIGIPAANIRVHQDHIGGGFGSKFGPDRWTIVQESRGQAGSRDAGAQLRTRSRGLPAFRLCPRESGGQKRRNHYRLAIAILGDRWSRRRRHAAYSLRFQHSQSAQRAHRHPQQYRSSPGLACSQPSTSSRNHDGRP